MTLINKRNSTKHCELARRDLKAGQKSSDEDMAGFSTSLKKVVDCCGNTFLIRLNDMERSMLNRLLELDSAGSSFRVVSHRDSHINILSPSALEKEKKIASIEAAHRHEESIMSETTYANRTDVKSAVDRANNIRGEVKAKKLEQNDVTGTVSISDLMSDNKFIEESMKHSNIPTSVASEQGWDMDKVNAPKVSGVEPLKEEPKKRPSRRGSRK